MADRILDLVFNRDALVEICEQCGPPRTPEQFWVALDSFLCKMGFRLDRATGVVARIDDLGVQAANIYEHMLQGVFDVHGIQISSASSEPAFVPIAAALKVGTAQAQHRRDMQDELVKLDEEIYRTQSKRAAVAAELQISDAGAKRMRPAK